MPIRNPSTEPRAIGHRRLPPFLAGRHQLAQLRRGDVVLHLAARRREQFAEPEQPDRDRHDADAVTQLGDPERVAEVAGHHVDADGAEQQPERRHQQRADQRRGRHVGEEDQAEHQQRGVFGRAEAQRESRERRRHQREHDDAEGAGDERADGGDAERGAGAALPAPSRCRRCRSSPRRLRPGCAAGSRWSSRRIASRSRCRRASRSPWWRRGRMSAAAEWRCRRAGRCRAACRPACRPRIRGTRTTARPAAARPRNRA